MPKQNMLEMCATHMRGKGSNTVNQSKPYAKIQHILSEKCTPFDHPSQMSSANIVSTDMYASGTLMKNVTKVLFTAGHFNKKEGEIINMPTSTAENNYVILTG